MQAYVEEFFIGLALCHTVQVSIPHSSKRELPVNGNGYVNNTFNADYFDYVYRASSPDEKALVEACRRYSTIEKKLLFIQIDTRLSFVQAGHCVSRRGGGSDSTDRFRSRSSLPPAPSAGIRFEQEADVYYYSVSRRQHLADMQRCRKRRDPALRQRSHC